MATEFRARRRRWSEDSCAPRAEIGLTTMTKQKPHFSIAEGEHCVLREGLFHGRSGLVTGAGSGIGRSIALRLVALGMHVFGTGRRSERLEETGRLAEGFPG